MPTKSVVITEHQFRMIEGLVKSGRYQNASEVLRDGLRLLELRDKEDKVCLTALRKAARLGMEDIKAGRVEPLDIAAIKAKGRAMLKARKLK